MVGSLSCKVLAKDLWDHVCVNKRLLSVPGRLFFLGKSIPFPSFLWKGKEIGQRPVWWDLMRMMPLPGASCSQGQLGASPRPVTLHCLEWPLPSPPAPAPPAPRHPQLSCCPALLAPLASLGKQLGFLLSPLHTSCSQTPHLQEALCALPLGLFLAKSLHWQGHLSTAAKFAFYLVALTLLRLLALLRVNGKQNVCVFQDFSSAPFFPLPFGTMLLIAPNRPDYLTTTIPHSKCMTHYRLFLLPAAYHKGNTRTQTKINYLSNSWKTQVVNQLPFIYIYMFNAELSCKNQRLIYSPSQP